MTKAEEFGLTTSLADRYQILSGPDIPAAIDECRRSQRAFPDIVHVQQLEFSSGPEYEGHSVVVGEEDFAIHGNR